MTGVQTCALPISGAEAAVVEELAGSGGGGGGIGGDMVETRLPDTKLVGSSTLPGLGRRW